MNGYDKMRTALEGSLEAMKRAMAILNGISPEEAGRLNARIEDAGDELCEFVESVIPDALAEPRRNCDAGTADEQAERFYAFCTRFSSGIGGMCDGNCPCLGSADGCHCLCKWGQMPYKKGGNDGG